MLPQNKTKYEKFFPLVLLVTIISLTLAGLYIFGFRFYYQIPEADANLASFLSGVASIVATFWLVFAVFIQMEGLRKTQDIAQRAIELEELNQARESVNYYQTILRPNSDNDIAEFEGAFNGIVDTMQDLITSRFINEFASPETISKHLLPYPFKEHLFKTLHFKRHKVEGSSPGVGVYRLNFDIYAGFEFETSELSPDDLKKEIEHEGSQVKSINKGLCLIKYEFRIRNPISIFYQNFFTKEQNLPSRVSLFIEDTRSVFEILKKNDSSYKLGDVLPDARRYLTGNHAIDYFVTAAGLVDAVMQYDYDSIKHSNFFRNSVTVRLYDTSDNKEYEFESLNLDTHFTLNPKKFDLEKHRVIELKKTNQVYKVLKLLKFSH